MTDLGVAIGELFRESGRAKDVFLAEEAPALGRAIEMVAEAIAAERKVLLFGNGGSAADAQHIAAELVGRFLAERRPLPAIALTGYGHEEDIQRSREAGFALHVTKPVSLHQLQEAIAAVTGEVRLPG